MKKLLPLLLVAPLLGACASLPDGLQSTASLETQAVAIVAKIQAGVAVAEADVKALVSIGCGTVLPAVQSGVTNVTSQIANPGPKTASAVGQVNAQVANAATACTQASSATGSPLINLALAIWNAVTRGKAAVAAAQNAAGT